MANQNKVKLLGVIDIGLNRSLKRSDPDSPPLRPIFCLKKREKMKELEEKEACFMLDFDPDDDDSLEFSQMSIQNNLERGFASDVSVVAQKGQVACRDYPHPRHVCVKYPFERTSHESYCEMCYCYICDVPAPCKYWSDASWHCDARDDDDWKFLRRRARELTNGMRSYDFADSDDE